MENGEPMPITSYGIVLFYIDSEFSPGENYDIKYLICQRRDTIEYTDFIRGRYTKLMLKAYLSLMSQEERLRILNYSFEDLWDDLWVNHNISFYKDSFAKAKLKFENNFELVKNIINNTESIVEEPIWGFPKGKKNPKESEIECSLREFKEETKLDLDYKNLSTLPPSKETFKGSNNKVYSTVYYIAQTPTILPIRKMSISYHNSIRRETISEEVSNLKWIKLNEAKSLFPTWRYKLLVEVENKIRKSF